jgi:hypothetical protein
MTKDFGFSLEERVFKNSASTQEKPDVTSMSESDPTTLDIGYVSLIDFLIKFGIALEILPDNYD